MRPRDADLGGLSPFGEDVGVQTHARVFCEKREILSQRESLTEFEDRLTTREQDLGRRRFEQPTREPFLAAGRSRDTEPFEQ